MSVRAYPCLVVFLACTLISLPSFADPVADTGVVGRLSEHFPGVEVARCMFPQGKLVVQSGELFHVLRKGDAVPGQPGLRVLEITDRHAILIQGPKGSGPGSTSEAAVPIPDRLVKIEKRPDGEVTVTVLSARIPRAVGPELLDHETVYSPWSEDSGKVNSGSGQGQSDGESGVAFAPLVAPRQVEVPENGSDGQADETGGDQ